MRFSVFSSLSPPLPPPTPRRLALCPIDNALPRGPDDPIVCQLQYLFAAFQHGVELATASGDLAGFVSRIGGIEPIIRGAAYARSQAMDVSFAAQVSVSSPLFNFPVEVIQRGRDHGEHEEAIGAG